MNLTRRNLLALAGMGAMGLAACHREHFDEQPDEPDPKPTPVAPEEPPAEPPVDYSEFEELALDMDAWSYDEVGDCYYQLSVPYCLTPASTQYESLAIFVPGAYFSSEKRGRTYRCTVAEDACVGSYTPASAPVVMPINTVSCSAQECPSSYAYEGLGRYLQAGLVYVYAGFRGRSGGYESTTQEYFSGGAPWPVVDLKAALRFLRYNAAVLPCDMARIFVCGQGSGGGLGAVLGSGGNDPAFTPYLSELGAVTHDLNGQAVGDEIAGVALWCPVASFNAADAAYEWMVGQYDSDGSRAEGTWTKMLSDDLSQAFGAYVNELGLVDGDGSLLELDRIEDGRYASGTYYDYLVRLIAEAAGDFLKTTEFPYTVLPLSTRQQFFPGNPSVEQSVTTDTTATASDETASAISGVRQVQATVYETRESYIASLNGDSRWLTYNASRGMADVTGLWSFVASCRPASREVCAYDALDRSGLANQLFGTSDSPSLHFDSMVARLVEEQSERYATAQDWTKESVAEWRGDLAEPDALDVTVSERVSMMDPISLLAGETMPATFADREATEDAEVLVEPPARSVAHHWRINTGLFQSETTFAGEVNLARALAAHEDVSEVLFEPVWGAGFELAERSGDPEDNLVAWICACCPADDAADFGDETESAETEDSQDTTDAADSSDASDAIDASKESDASEAPDVPEESDASEVAGTEDALEVAPQEPTEAIDRD